MPDPIPAPPWAHVGARAVLVTTSCDKYTSTRHVTIKRINKQSMTVVDKDDIDLRVNLRTLSISRNHDYSPYSTTLYAADDPIVSLATMSIRLTNEVSRLRDDVNHLRNELDKPYSPNITVEQLDPMKQRLRRIEEAINRINGES